MGPRRGSGVRRPRWLHRFDSDAGAFVGVGGEPVRSRVGRGVGKPLRSGVPIPGGFVGAASAGATAVPTSIDPCQLITSQEAGTLVGTTFGAGKESTTEGNARICTYGAQTLNIFSVEVAQAPDVATAKAAEADLKTQASQLAAGGLTVTQLPNFAPGADAALMEGTVSVGGTTLGARAIYVLRGATLFGFSDVALNKAPPSADAMKTEAMTVLGRIP